MTNWKDIVYHFDRPVSPCVYDFLDYLVDNDYLEIEEFHLPELSTRQRAKIESKHHLKGRRHYKSLLPRIQYALHQRGYRYENMVTESLFRGWKPDVLATPCHEDNGGGFIPVEVGSLTLWSKVLVCEESFVTEMWLIPQGELVHVFKGLKDLKPAWEWQHQRVENIIQQEWEQDRCMSLIRGRGCNSHPECWVEYQNKCCRDFCWERKQRGH